MRFVGRRLKVYWPLDNEWYGGVVQSLDANNCNRVLVLYDDNEKEWIDLCKEEVRWQASAGQKLQRSSAKSQRISGSVKWHRHSGSEEFSAMRAQLHKIAESRLGMQTATSSAASVPAATADGTTTSAVSRPSVNTETLCSPWQNANKRFQMRPVVSPREISEDQKKKLQVEGTCEC